MNCRLLSANLASLRGMGYTRLNWPSPSQHTNDLPAGSLSGVVVITITTAGYALRAAINTF